MARINLAVVDSAGGWDWGVRLPYLQFVVGCVELVDGTSAYAMSQQDNFASGFIAGAFVGGVVGGVIGVLVSSRLNQDEGDNASDRSLINRSESGQSFEDMTEAGMEIARQGLESKIAQLNEAIDDVRQQLDNVNGHSQPRVYDDPSTIDS
ncbi:MAG: hypothetical protein AAF215_18595 [Cyanobacteria bacterium P01_A01_bin.123]